MPKKCANRLLGSSYNCEEEREINDFYATNPKCVLDLLDFGIPFSKNIWEPACGLGHISKTLKENGFIVRESDIINRMDNEVLDFLNSDEKFDGDIITNPPFKIAKEFIEKSMDTINVGNHVAMFLKLQLLEGNGRFSMFKKYPPKYVYVYVKRVGCAKGGDFSNGDIESAMCYCWYIWEKGFIGEPIIRWIDPAKMH